MSSKESDEIDTARMALLYASDRLKTVGTVQNVLKRFRPILSEFLAFIQNFLAALIYNNSSNNNDNSKSAVFVYEKKLNNLIETFERVYGVVPTVMVVNFTRYDVGKWGHLYWSFLHYSSILVQYALTKKYIHNTEDFATLVFNIDTILSCSTCKSHYLAIKHTTKVRELIKLIAFGHVVEATYKFHALITENKINNQNNNIIMIAPPQQQQLWSHQKQQQQQQQQNVMTMQAAERRRRAFFPPHEFAKLYNVYPMSTLNARRMDDIQRPLLDWQENVHVLLASLLAIDHNVSVSRASNRLKRTQAYKTALDDALYRDVLVETEINDEFRSNDELTFDDITDGELEKSIDANLRDQDSFATYTKLKTDILLLSSKKPGTNSTSIINDIISPLTANKDLRFLDAEHRSLLTSIKKQLRETFPNYPVTSLLQSLKHNNNNNNNV